jgi:hypothetical protein
MDIQMNLKIIEEVYELLLNAEDNGYPQWHRDPLHVAEEIVDQTGFFEDMPIEELTMYVEEAQRNNR